MADLAELLAKVKAATGPDREIDGALSAALRVGKNLPDWALRWGGEWRPTIQGSVVLIEDNGNIGPHYSSPEYTASIDAALALVGRVLPGWCWLIRNDDKDGFMANLFESWDFSEDAPRWPRYAPTAPLAICKSLLSILIAQKAEG
jgi:hypothetical protein